MVLLAFYFKDEVDMCEGRNCHVMKRGEEREVRRGPETHTLTLVYCFYHLQRTKTFGSML